jgi:hypothetical protein
MTGGNEMKKHSLTNLVQTRGAVLTASLVLGLLTTGARASFVSVVDTSAVFSDSWGFPSGALPITPAAVKIYSATAIAGARADGLTGVLYGIPVTGAKLTFTSTGPGPSGSYTPGKVTADDAITGTLGSVSTGTISISGAHTGLGTNTATISGKATVVAGSKPGASASFFANARDPFPFQMQDLSPIPSGTLIDFSLTLPASGTILPPGEDWSVTYSSAIKDINTSDDTVFYNANPDSLYSMTISSGPGGFSANFVPGNPSGFPITFSETPAQIDAAVLADLASGWSSDLTLVSGQINAGGHTSATIGNSLAIEADAAAPEPSDFLMMAAGALLVFIGKKHGKRFAQQM